MSSVIQGKFSKWETVIGLEIHAQAFGFATDDEINDMTFYAYKVINKATTNLNETTDLKKKT